MHCIPINKKSAATLVLIFILNGIQQSNTYNGVQQAQSQKSNKENLDSIGDNAPLTITKNQTEISNCPKDIECKSLNFPCIKCKYKSDCNYGEDTVVTCEAKTNIDCNGPKVFERIMNCRYCYLTEIWQYNCISKTNCNSISSKVLTNCTVHENVLCLGNRTFLKQSKCNWTHGYKWSTALIISLTLGGFGADRFYLGHWQEGIGKLFSFGGLGVWTIIDVLLISLHYLGPADGSLYI